MISVNIINSIVNARTLAGLSPVEPTYYLCPRCCGRHAELCQCTHTAGEGFGDLGCGCHRCGYHGPILASDDGGEWEPIDSSMVFIRHPGIS